MKKIVVDKDLLYHYYIEENNNIEETSKLMSISYRTIQRAIKDYGFNKDQEQKLNTRKKTTFDRYGKTNVYQIKEIKDKCKKTKLERYNDTNFNNSEKQKQTMIDKYGVKCGYNLQKVQDKIINLYGGKGYSSNEISEKIKETNLNRYGVEYPTQNESIKRKAIMSCRKTNLEKYGVSHNFMRDEVRDKISQTVQEKYGVPYYCLREECFSKNGYTVSKVNSRFSELLASNSIVYEQEYRINNKSYDFKIGNILIELNPTYTHNSTKPTWFHNSEKEPLAIDYHITKTKLARDNNYRCIHIWDWDNTDKILELLKPKEIIYARKCEVREIPIKETNEFINKYHLQNTCKGQDIRLGLYYKNELVQIMTFGKPRYNKNFEYELLRLCTKSNYTVVGGANKIFKYFIKIFNPNSIISYCDNSKFSGDIYPTLGFILKDYGGPSKHWFDGKRHITDNLLRQRGFDQLFNTNYGKGISNVELMINHNFVEIYDSGQSTYIWNRS